MLQLYKVMAMACGLYGSKTRTLHTKSVSYTHLDVYKRQVLPLSDLVAKALCSFSLCLICLMVFISLAFSGGLNVRTS